MMGHAHFLRNFKFVVFAVAALVLQAGAASSASAANYSVNGRVYTAARVLTGQTAPNNPLSSIPASETLKDKGLTDVGLYAVSTRSLVRVSAEAADGTAYGKPFLAKYSGAYNIGIVNAPANLQVKLVVRNAFSNEKMMESPLTVLSPSPAVNTRFLLVEGDGDDMGVPHPGTNLFTAVGKIPNDGSSISSVTGLVTVSAANAAAFGIPQYANAPFGSVLDINGAFSSQYYVPGSPYCYKPLANGVPIKDPLYKTRYTVTTVNGALMVKAEQVLVGPQKIGAVLDCYAITPVAQTVPGQEIFWNFPDRLISWNTSPIGDGTVQVSLQLYNTTNNTVVNLGPNAFSTLKLHINNEPVVVGFSSIANGPKNMLDPANACDIVHMAQGLQITYKAYHPNAAGYLSGYFFDAVPTAGPAVTIAAGSYTGAPLTGTPAAGANTTLTNAQITHSCAYIFRLWAMARTTNGYWYINGAYTEKAYYLQ